MRVLRRIHTASYSTHVVQVDPSQEAAKNPATGGHKKPSRMEPLLPCATPSCGPLHLPLFESYPFAPFGGLGLVHHLWCCLCECMQPSKDQLERRLDQGTRPAGWRCERPEEIVPK